MMMRRIGVAPWRVTGIRRAARSSGPRWRRGWGGPHGAGSSRPQGQRRYAACSTDVQRLFARGCERVGGLTADEYDVARVLDVADGIAMQQARAACATKQLSGDDDHSFAIRSIELPHGGRSTVVLARDAQGQREAEALGADRKSFRAWIRRKGAQLRKAQEVGASSGVAGAEAGAAGLHSGDGGDGGAGAQQEASLEAAVAAFREAASAGHPMAGYMAAKVLLNASVWDPQRTWLTEAEVREAVQWLREAPAQVHQAAYELGRVMHEGMLGPEVRQEGHLQLQVAAKRGNANAAYYLGHQLHAQATAVAAEQERDEEQVALAMQYLEQAVAAKHPAAMYYLAMACGSGDGCEQDVERMFELLEGAADLGWADAAYFLGQASFQGAYGRPVDYGRALRWFEQAADDGHADAMCAAGAMRYKGLGRSKSPVAAFRLYQRAALLGSVQGLRNCAHMLVTPDSGIRTSQQLARVYLEKAKQLEAAKAVDHVAHVGMATFGLCVRSRGREEHVVQVTAKMTVWNVKVLLFPALDVLPHQLQVYKFDSRDKELKSDWSLSSCKIGPETVLWVQTSGANVDHSWVVAGVSGDSPSSPALRAGESVPLRVGDAVSAPRTPAAKTWRKKMKKISHAHCFAFGEGLHNVVVGFPVRFFVYFATKDGKQVPASVLMESKHLLLKMEGGSVDFIADVTDDGLLHVEYTPLAPGDDFIHIALFGARIHRSPYPITIRELGRDHLEGIRQLANLDDWKVQSVEILHHMACVVDAVEQVILVGADTLLNLCRTRTPRDKAQQLLARIWWAILSEDHHKQQLMTECGVPLLITLVNTRTWLYDRELHRFVCRMMMSLIRLDGAAADTFLTELNTSVLLVLPKGCGPQSPVWLRTYVQFLSVLSAAGSAFSKQLTNILDFLMDINASLNDSTIRYSIVKFMSELHPKALQSVVAFPPAFELVLSSCSEQRLDHQLAALKCLQGLVALDVTDNAWKKRIANTLFDVVEATDTLCMWEVSVPLAMYPQSNDDATSDFEMQQLAHDQQAFDLIRASMKALLCLLQSDTTATLAGRLTPAVYTQVTSYLSSVSADVSALAMDVVLHLSGRTSCHEQLRRYGAIPGLVTCLTRVPNELETHRPILRALRVLCAMDASMVLPVDEKGFTLLVQYLYIDDKEVKECAAVVLIHLSQSERYKPKLISTAGHQFLSHLIELVRAKEVNILVQISIDDIQLGKEIGRGACSRVWSGVWNGQAVAVKRFNEKFNAWSEREFGSELAIMSMLRHPNICHCIGGSTIPGCRFLVCPLYKRGSLLTVLRNDKYRLSMTQRLRMAYDCANGMQYLHSAGIIHRDLKSGNLLVSKSFHCAVMDFGISRMVNPEMSKRDLPGTPAYVAPEVIMNSEHSKRADVFSFGIVLWELMTRTTPYGKMRSPMIIMQVCEGLRPDVPPSLPKPIASLIQRCWHADPDARPTFDQIAVRLEELPGLLEMQQRRERSDSTMLLSQSTASMVPAQRSSSGAVALSASAEAASLSMDDSSTASAVSLGRDDSPRGISNSLGSIAVADFDLAKVVDGDDVLMGANLEPSGDRTLWRSSVAKKGSGLVRRGSPPSATTIPTVNTGSAHSSGDGPPASMSPRRKRPGSRRRRRRKEPIASSKGH